MNRFIGLLALSLMFVSVVKAKPLTPEQVPEPLKPWVDWVLQDNPERVCPFIYNSYEQKRCSWPTVLTLNLTQNKADFAISWRVYRDSWISLPGDGKHWPLNVTVDGKKALVMNRNGIPSIKLTAKQDQQASHHIKGAFFWDSIPDNLVIPIDTGLINLTVNGSAVRSPAVKDGQLWLKESDVGQRKTENSQNNVDLQVFRKIIDDVPIQVSTLLVLEISGEQRGLKLAQPMPDGFIPLTLHSPLPARLDPDGQLLIQLRPGRWQIEMIARSPKELNAIPFAKVADKQVDSAGTNFQEWPQSEIWVFDARPDLRVVEIENVNAIDASQTNLPDDWKSLPAYKINQGQIMGLKPIRRGDPEPEPNQLNLTRKLWLDFDGNGYTINDTITGKMTSGWRLNALPENRLGRVTLDGGNQLITQQQGSDKQGVEVRKGMILLDADSRKSGSISKLSAVGWEQAFHHVNAELNLPPGWRLLAANGVDNVPDSWISRWTLLDLFLVLVAALATARLWTRNWGFFALATLSLIWHEPGSPHFIWLNILAATALITVLPKGKFYQFINGFRKAFWLALIVIAVPFMIDQVRMGLYPQLEKPWQSIMAPQYPAVDTMPAESAPVAVMQEPMISKSRSNRQDYAGRSPGSDSYYADKSVGYDRIDPNAKVQTGPGLPQWQWHKIALSWNGSVDAGQQLRLWYLTPMMTMLLNFIRVACIAVLALLMFGLADKFKFRIKTANPVLIGFLLLPMFSMSSQDVRAEFPDQAMLDTLRSKLLEAPDCLPDCAQIPEMKLAISDKELLVTLEIHAQHAVAVPLPADYEQWFPNQVLVDGETAEGLYRNNNGLWIGLEEGGHQVVMRGVTPILNKFSLPLPVRPSRVTIDSTGWQVAGIQDDGQVDNQLQFSRMKKTPEPDGKAIWAPGVLPPFVRIERTVLLGLDWRVMTRILRISPLNSPVLLAVPLLPGESVTTSGIRVKDGNVDVNMAGDQTLLQWESTLEKSEQIELTAAQTGQWVDVWKVDVSPIWHIESSGIAAIHQNNEARWLPEFRPWPGEKMTLRISRPKAAQGQTLTIDNTRLSIKPGIRGREADLSLSLRSSQGAQHTLVLPEQAVLQSVAIDGLTQPIRQEGRKLTLPVRPGKQEISMNWQEAVAMAPVISTPRVDLGQESVNNSLNISLGQDRWVLFVMGPTIGPAVLFWGVLIVIVILSLGLAKIPLTPLTNRQWFLLLVGLSQIPMATALIVIAWLMLLGWRAHKSAKDMVYFNALQASIGALTLLSLGVLFFAVAQGLLSSPEMQIIGNQSSAFSLNWYQDRSPSALPAATVISVPVYAYRFLMLAWSLWLAVSLLDWLKWGWGCFSSNGLWVKTATEKKAAAQQSEK